MVLLWKSVPLYTIWASLQWHMWICKTIMKAWWNSKWVRILKTNPTYHINQILHKWNEFSLIKEVSKQNERNYILYVNESSVYSTISKEFMFSHRTYPVPKQPEVNNIANFCSNKIYFLKNMVYYFFNLWSFVCE